MSLSDFLPVSPFKGPPLPKRMGVYWRGKNAMPEPKINQTIQILEAPTYPKPYDMPPSTYGTVRIKQE